MRIVRFPQPGDWPELLSRPKQDSADIRERVTGIIAEVRRDGDAALRQLTKLYDGIDLAALTVSADKFAAAESALGDDLKRAIRLARQNIERFHAALVDPGIEVETAPGVFCSRRSVAIERVGLYVPAGTAPLFSTVLMLAVPARIAGCREIVLCTPPGPDGSVHPAILYSAAICGVTKVVKAGGAQAIAALAFGTESVPRVSKIFGPGNQFVTEAKLQVSLSGVAIDMPAGPSEVMVVADDTAVPEFLAADLLSQAEHGPDSQVMLVTTSERVLNETLAGIETQINVLPRREIALAALGNSRAILVDSIKTAIEISNEYAPEHLILAVADAENIADSVINAGSVFIGNLACEAAGDYASGTNHTLPTNGAARAFSGVSVDSFVRKITFQRLTPEGIRSIGPAIELMAEAENLRAHRNAVSVRLRSLAPQ